MLGPVIKKGVSLTVKGYLLTLITTKKSFFLFN